MQEILFKGLLKKAVFNTYSHKVPDTLFEDHYGVLYKTLVNARKKLDVDLNVNDFKLLFFTANPALTYAQRDVFEQLLQKLATVESPSEEVTCNVFEDLVVQEKVRKFASYAVEYLNGNKESLEALKGMVLEWEDAQQITTDITEINYEIEDLLKYGANKGEFKINIPGLSQYLPGLDRATLTAIFARPETGKTASWITLMAGPEGFASSGHKCVVVGNEEPVIRSQLRCVNASSGLTLESLLQDKSAFELAHKEWQRIKPNVKLYDAVGLSISDLDYICRKDKPDILVVDTLDKISVGGTFARDDLRIKQLYVQARELAKKHKLAFVATSQASAEAEDRKILTLDMMENSRTGKAAECDVIIGIGKFLQGEINTPLRHMYLCKNKLTGIHDVATVRLDNTLSRYVA